MRRYESRKILEALNEAYSDAPDPSEEALREGMRRHHRRLVEEHSKIGTLSRRRVRQILDGIRLIIEPREVDE
jgi:hypothetical protein